MAGAPGARRALLGDLEEVADQVEELAAVGELVGQARGHQRRPARLPLLDVPAGDRDERAVARRVAEEDRVGPLAREQAGERLAVARGDGDGLETLADLLRRGEDRLDDVPVRLGAADRGQVGPERRGLALVIAGVATGALE